MKKMLPVFVAGFLILGGLGAVAVSVNNQEQFLIVDSFYFSQPSLSEKNHYTIVMLPEATSNMMQTDKPSLPVVSKVYVFPFGTDITDVTVSFGAFTELSLDKPVMLSPEPQMVSPVFEQTTAKQNLVIQSDESWYPSSLYSYRVGSGIHNSERVVFLVVHLFPVSCKQIEYSIRYYDEATVDISYTSPANPVIFGSAYDLLILTPSQFTSRLQPLVNYKNDNGIATVMVNLNEIYGGTYFPVTGRDNPEKIKYFIKNAIEAWGITSVILVGAGVKGQEIFPVRNAWIPSDPYEQYFPSDLYYADIYDRYGGFSSWDYNNNGKYCEYPWDLPAVDLYPDVYLGRLACNDAGEVTTVVNKIIAFKEHNKMMNKILQLGGDTFPGDPSNINEGEYANTEVMKKLPGYTSTRLWASLGTLTKDNIRSNINKGYDFVDCSGHGSWASWATHPPRDKDTWLPAETFYSPYAGFLYIDVDLFVNNRKLPVFVLNACSTSKFSESPTCLGWKILSKPYGGGIASFGASGIGYGMLGKDITTRVFGWMEVRLFQELYTTKMLGGVWANAINGYVNSFFMIDLTDYKTVVELTLFGDPTTVIADGKEPRSYNLAGMNTVPNVFAGMRQSRLSLFLSRVVAVRQAMGQQTQN